MRKWFGHPSGPTNQAGVTLPRKSVFVFFTPVDEAPYTHQLRRLWGCGFADRRLSSPPARARKVPVQLPSCALPPMFSICSHRHPMITSTTSSKVRCALQALLPCNSHMCHVLCVNAKLSSEGGDKEKEA